MITPLPRIETFVADNSSALNASVNTWLDNDTGIGSVTDIKFSTHFDSASDRDVFCALVIYQERT